MRGDLYELITVSFDAEAADAWRKFRVGDADKKVLGEAGKRVLELFSGRQAGQCALMSAAYVWALEKLGTQPAYLVAGSLYIGDELIFGEEFDGKKLFSESNLDWDGHAWVVYGDWLADVSILRTARGGTPRALASYVAKVFDPKSGLFCCNMATMGGSDLRYVPQYVLPEDQVTGLQRGVLATLDAQDTGKSKNNG
jgi:hypothetical protein